MGGKSKPSAKTARRPAISRAAAGYVVRHVENARRLLAQAATEGTPLAFLSTSFTTALADLSDRVLSPILRMHPDIPANGLPLSQTANGKKIYTATRKDITKATATRLMKELLSIRDSMHAANSGTDTPELDLKDLEPITDIGDELHAAMKVMIDAWPDIWKKEIEARLPPQERTEESDANFRKQFLSKGSVKLTRRALAKIRTSMKDLRAEMRGKHDPIACISWAEEQSFKGPEDDAVRTYSGPGLWLGAFWRSQLPPDVIDKVSGIEIVFFADSPFRLAGKTVDYQKKGYVILEQ